LAGCLLPEPRMWRTCVIVSSLCLGGCFASYRSVSGRVFGPDVAALDDALRDSGSTNLLCDAGAVRVRRFVTGRDHAALIAEGCGQRASYELDCSVRARTAAAPPRCPGSDIGLADSTCRSYDDYGPCELVLFSKVALDEPGPSPR